MVAIHFIRESQLIANSSTFIRLLIERKRNAITRQPTQNSKVMEINFS
jgi:hypothetical protein